MTDLEYFKLALASLHQGAWFTWKTHDADGNKIAPINRMTYANIVVTKEGVSKPSEAEVNAKIQEIKDAETARANKKASGKAKLKALGLDDEELKTLGL
jgi:Skp family chaperone for outer membrane proteins